MIGINNVPVAGDEFEVVDSLEIAREKAESRAESLRNERISAKAGDGKVTLSSWASAVSAGKVSGLDLHQLNIIMKVDVQVCIFTQNLLRLQVAYGSSSAVASVTEDLRRDFYAVGVEKNRSFKFISVFPLLIFYESSFEN